MDNLVIVRQDESTTAWRHHGTRISPIRYRLALPIAAFTTYRFAFISV